MAIVEQQTEQADRKATPSELAEVPGKIDTTWDMAMTLEQWRAVNGWDPVSRRYREDR